MVAIDFSIHSRRAVQLAATLAPGGALRLVHAFFAPRPIQGATGSYAATKGEARALRRQFAAELDAIAAASPQSGLHVETVVHAGDPERVIRREVERCAADLLVVGTHGRTGLPLAVLGSVAEGLLADPPCDVAAVRAW